MVLGHDATKLQGSPRRVSVEAWTLLVLLAAAGGLRLYGLNKSLWLDEGYSISAALHLQGFDAGRPLYFVGLERWMHWGGSEVWLRLPSLIFGVASVAMGYIVARCLGTRSIASVAALLMALSSAQVFHSQEVRMYTLAPLLLLVAVYALLRWLVHRHSAWLVVHCLAAYLALLTFPLVAIGLGAMWLLGAWSVRSSKNVAITLLGAASLTTLAWLPFAIVIARYPEMTQWIARPSINQVSTVQGWALVSTGLWQAPIPWRVTLVVTRVVSLAILVLAVVGGMKYRAVGVWYFVIVAVVYAASVLQRPIWTYHYFMPFFPALFFLIAAGLDRIRAFSRSAFALALALFASLELLSTFASASTPFEDWRAVAQDVSSASNHSDLVVSSGAPLRLDTTNTGVWSYYYRGDAPVVYWDADSADAWFDKLASLRQQRGQDKKRIWFIIRTAVKDGPGLVAALKARLAQSFAVRGETFTGLELLRLDARD